MPSTILSDNGASSGTAGLKSTGSNDGQLVLQTTTAGGAVTTAMTINTGQAVTFAQTANLPNTFGFKNRIINGAMVIDQRNAGASVTGGTSVNYPVDRFGVYGSQASKFTAQRSSTAPAGFNNSILITSSSAYSIVASDIFRVEHYIEGFNTADLGFGSANAKTVTLSFWVRSSLTGTFGGSLMNAATNRAYPFSYSISAADTWEQKSITIAGDTTGTWVGATNGIGLRVFWGLGVGADYSGTAGAWNGTDDNSVTGAVSVVGTNAATWYITGVQLEAGSTATSFDYRDYGRELILCQRYYWKILPDNAGAEFCVAYGTATTNAAGIVFFPASMRIAPTALEQTGTAGDYRVYRCGAATNTTCSSVPVFSKATPNYGLVIFTVASGLTNGSAGSLGTVNTSAYLAWSAEL